MSSMKTKTGLVESVSKDGKRFKLDEAWYSVFNIASANGASVGDEVKFAYVEKESGGVMYNNIKGSVTVLSATTSIGEASPKSSGKSSSSTNMQIIRQNALTNAVAFWNAGSHKASVDQEDAITQIVTIAHAFSKFSSGEWEENMREQAALAEVES